MTDLPKVIGMRLQGIRKSKGLRQEDMEEFGLNYKYYQRIEGGRTNITLTTLEKVATALGVDVADLFVLPMSESSEVNRLLTDISALIKEDDPLKIKKLGLFLREIL